MTRAEREHWQDGGAIRDFREAKGYSRERLAKEVGYHQSQSLTHVELGTRPASLEVLLRIADALDIALLPIVRRGSVLHIALTRDSRREAAA